MLDVRMLALAGIALSAAVTAAIPALAQQGLDEPFQKPFRDALKGKTVAYVPVAMSAGAPP